MCAQRAEEHELALRVRLHGVAAPYGCTATRRLLANQLYGRLCRSDYVYARAGNGHGWIPLFRSEQEEGWVTVHACVCSCSSSRARARGCVLLFSKRPSVVYLGFPTHPQGVQR